MESRTWLKELHESQSRLRILKTEFLRDSGSFEDTGNIVFADRLMDYAASVQMTLDQIDEAIEKVLSH